MTASFEKMSTSFEKMAAPFEKMPASFEKMPVSFEKNKWLLLFEKNGSLFRKNVSLLRKNASFLRKKKWQLPSTKMAASFEKIASHLRKNASLPRKKCQPPLQDVKSQKCENAKHQKVENVSASCFSGKTSGLVQITVLAQTKTRVQTQTSTEIETPMAHVKMLALIDSQLGLVGFFERIEQCKRHCRILFHGLVYDERLVPWAKFIGHKRPRTINGHAGENGGERKRIDKRSDGLTGLGNIRLRFLHSRSHTCHLPST